MLHKSQFLVFFLIFPAVLSAQKQDIPCGLPPFVDKLSNAHQEELRQIWKDYKAGDNCTDQQSMTFKLMEKITPEEKNSLFSGPEVVDTFDDIPTFIRSMTPALKARFDAIWGNINVSEDERLSLLNNLAISQFSEQQKQGFEAWVAQVKRVKMEVQDKINNLSPEAKKILQEIMNIREEERKINNRLTPSLRKELEGLI